MHLLYVLSDGDGVSEGSAAQVAGEALPLVVRKVALHVQLVTVTLTEPLPAKLASETINFRVKYFCTFTVTLQWILIKMSTKWLIVSRCS